MNYTCPKCGKKMDLSTEVLINSQYKVICPQCLSELHIVGDYAYIPQDSLELDTTVKPSHTINCPSCGHEANSNAHFCPNCGASFDTSSPSVIDVVPEEVSAGKPSYPGNDPLYNEAIQFLAQCTAITPMMLRDRFHISDERAAELIRQLEAGGIIGPYNNGGPRQILIPHRSMYNRIPMQQQNPMQGNVPPQGQTGPQPRRFSCLTIVLIMLFFIYLMKACGM
jgi:transcription elongation factor Elf1